MIIQGVLLCIRLGTSIAKQRHWLKWDSDHSLQVCKHKEEIYFSLSHSPLVFHILLFSYFSHVHVQDCQAYSQESVFPWQELLLFPYVPWFSVQLVLFHTDTEIEASPEVFHTQLERYLMILSGPSIHCVVKIWMNIFQCIFRKYKVICP